MNRTKVVAAWLASLMLGLNCPFASAGPPFITDDPVPVDKGHGEFYIASIDTWTSDGVGGTLPHFEFNYGPIDNVQLHIITPLSYDRPNDAPTMQYGYGDTELGVKWRLIQEDSLFKGCPQVATFPLLELPTGDEHHGLGNGRAQEFVPVWLQKSFGEGEHAWAVYGGGGYWFNSGHGNKDYGFVGAVVQKQVTEHLALGLEIFHSTSSAVGEDSHTGFNVGGIYDFSDHWHFMLSAGRDFDGDNRLTGYAALQFTF